MDHEHDDDYDEDDINYHNVKYYQMKNDLRYKLVNSRIKSIYYNEFKKSLI